MAGRRNVDIVARDGQAEPRGSQRAPGLVAKEGIQAIRRVQDAQMNINHEETLLFYDCELLFQARDRQGQTYIVSHTGDSHKECEYMAVPVDQRSLSDFKAGRIDLRGLMLAGSRKEWYSAKATGDSNELVLELPEYPAGRIAGTAHEGLSSRPQVQRERKSLSKTRPNGHAQPATPPPLATTSGHITSRMQMSHPSMS